MRGFLLTLLCRQVRTVGSYRHGTIETSNALATKGKRVSFWRGVLGR